jgi:hypothetical protein
MTARRSVEVRELNRLRAEARRELVGDAVLDALLAEIGRRVGLDLKEVREAIAAALARDRLDMAPLRAPTRKSPRLENEGQRRLLEIPDSQAEVAAAVGCSKPLVGFWRQAKNVPSDRLREALEREYGIPAGAWDRLPGTVVELRGKGRG